MSLKLNNPIWDKAKRANVYSKAIYAVGVEAVKDVAANIDKSVPAGRTYRRPKLKFSGRGAARKGVVTGYKLHKASAKGQPPAKDTKRLYKGTKVKRKAAFSVIVYNDVPYAVYLEPPAKLNRPFLEKPILANRKKYVEMIDKASRTLT